MTVKELYEWAKRLKSEDCKIEIQHRDSGGYYPGTDQCDNPTVEYKNDGTRYVLL